MASRSIGIVTDHGFDVVCDWQAILLEETGKYYYWNKFTNETTWEKPIALQQHEVLMKARKVDNSNELNKEHLLKKQHVRKVSNFVSSIKLKFEFKANCEHDGLVKAPLGVLEQPGASPISNFHIGNKNDSHKDLESRIINVFGNGESGANEVQNDNNLTTSPEPNNYEVNKDVMIKSYDRAMVSMVMLNSLATTLDHNLTSNVEKPCMFHILIR